MDRQIRILKTLKENNEKALDASIKDGIDKYVGSYYRDNIEALDKAIKIFECIKEVG